MMKHIRILSFFANFLLLLLIIQGASAQGPVSDSTIVIEDTQVRIYNASGQLQGSTILTDGRADVVNSTDFIVAIGKSTVRIFDLLGHLILSIHTQGQAEVIICPDNFTIIDNTKVRIYNGQATVW